MIHIIIVYKSKAKHIWIRECIPTRHCSLAPGVSHTPEQVKKNYCQIHDNVTWLNFEGRDVRDRHDSKSWKTQSLQRIQQRTLPTLINCNSHLYRLHHQFDQKLGMQYHSSIVPHYYILHHPVLNCLDNYPLSLLQRLVYSDSNE